MVIRKVVYDEIVGKGLVTGFIKSDGSFAATVTDEHGKVIKRARNVVDASLWAERASGLIVPKPVCNGNVIPLVFRKLFKV